MESFKIDKLKELKEQQKLLEDELIVFANKYQNLGKDGTVIKLYQQIKNMEDVLDLQPNAWQNKNYTYRNDREIKYLTELKEYVGHKKIETRRLPTTHPKAKKFNVDLYYEMNPILINILGILQKQQSKIAELESKLINHT
jgi:hypothetical protein